MKKLAMAIGIVILLVAGVVGGGLYSVFGHNKPVEEGAQYGRATVVVDLPYVAMYLVDIGGGKYVLVDGGASPDAHAVLAALAEKGAKPEDIEAMLLTHAHGDHVGAAYGLPNVPLWVHEADVAMAEGHEAGKSSLAAITGPNPTGLHVTNTFKGGDKLKFGDATFEVFHAPGHTAGNCAFLVGDVLLLGDTAQVTKADNLHSPPTFFDDDPEQAIASIRALGDAFEMREKRPTRLVPAHSGATQNIAALLDYDGDID